MLLKSCLICAVVTLCTVGTASVSAQDAVNLIASFSPTKQVAKGDWTFAEGELRVAASQHALVSLLAEPGPAYSVEIEFTRTAGDDGCGIVLPVGPTQCVLNLSVFGGEGHGLAVVDGKMARDNVTTVRPGTLETGKRYRLSVDVDARGEEASIHSQLDGKPLVSWTGSPATLTLLDFWRIPQKKSLGLFANAGTVFHSVTLKQSMPAEMTRPAQSPATAAGKRIVFEGRQWDVSRADQGAIEQFAGRESLHIVGGEKTFVPLIDADFKTGTIEVDLASATFCGVGFCGNDAGDVAELVYVRPFNSGTAKHDKTLQYAMMGVPEHGWQELREKFPGKYEAGADLAVNKWVRLRVVVSDDKVSVFVGDGPNPVFETSDRLGTVKRGSIGLWTWNGYFSNVRVSGT